jgi:hypothetical protein
MQRIVAVVRLMPWALTGLAAGAPAQESSTARVEKEITITAELPAPRPACGVDISVQYFQANTVAKVESTVAVEGCPVAAVEYTIVARIRDESLEVKTLEFNETFRPGDAQTFTREVGYPIGENVELLSVRARGMRCTCVEQAP